jgi:cell division protein FtsB
MNKIARSNRGKDVLSFAREHAWQPRDGSNVHTFLPVLLERLEAENAQLRGSVVELTLQVQALRDALGHPQSLEQLEAENAQLRGSVVELALQVQALRDALGHPQSETQPHRPSAQ